MNSVCASRPEPYQNLLYFECCILHMTFDPRCDFNRKRVATHARWPTQFSNASEKLAVPTSSWGLVWTTDVNRCFFFYQLCSRRTMQLSFYEATNLQSSVCTSCRVVVFLLAALEVVHIMYMTTTHYLT